MLKYSQIFISYKLLNKILRWIRYPNSNRKDLLDILYTAIIISNFDIKSGYWEVQITEKDSYKTASTIPLGIMNGKWCSLA